MAGRLLLKTVDYFTVSLHSPNDRHLPDIKAVLGDGQWEFPCSLEPIMHCKLVCKWGFHSLYLDHLNTKGFHQPVTNHDHPPLTVLHPPGYDCVAVYEGIVTVFNVNQMGLCMSWSIKRHYYWIFPIRSALSNRSAAASKCHIFHNCFLPREEPW